MKGVAQTGVIFSQQRTLFLGKVEGGLGVEAPLTTTQLASPLVPTCCIVERGALVIIDGVDIRAALLEGLCHPHKADAHALGGPSRHRRRAAAQGGTVQRRALEVIPSIRLLHGLRN